MTPGEVVNGYTIIKKIGGGGMSIVYLAEDAAGTRVVVKEMRPEYLYNTQLVDRFIRSATALKGLRHPHLVQVVDSFEHNGRYVIVEGYLSGGSLAELIATQGPPSERESLEWCRDALHALNYVHEQGIVHRDLKPSNLMLGEDRGVRVIDFGIARVFGEKTLTRAGDGSMGTPWYMSPEQITDPRAVDHLTDVYSAGVVLYELLTGQVPFDGPTDFSIHQQITQNPAPPMAMRNPAVTPALEQLVRKAIDKDKTERYSGCGEFAEEIQRYLDAAEAGPSEDRVASEFRDETTTVPGFASRRVVVGAAVAIGVIAVGVVATMAFGGLMAGPDAPQIGVTASVNRSTVSTIGAQAIFEYTVTNKGNVPLRNIRVVDNGDSPASLQSGDANQDGALDVDERWLFRSTMPIEASHVNSGQKMTRTVVVSSDRATSPPYRLHVQFERRPAVAISTLVNGARAASLVNPGPVTYTYRVANRGNVPLTGVRVSDRHNVLPQSTGGDSNRNQALDPGETWEYQARVNVTRQSLNGADSLASRATVVSDLVKAEANETVVALRSSAVTNQPEVVVARPARIRHLQPEYPGAAGAASVQGDVRLELTIGAGGAVQSARILQSTARGPASSDSPATRALLDRAALDAARQWVYAPTLVNGVAVPVIADATVRFVLTPEGRRER